MVKFNHLLQYLLFLFCFHTVTIQGTQKTKNINQSIRFQHLQTQQGLSSNVSGSILQDKSGFLWFGTDAGLNRYDGYGIKVYRQNSKLNSISNDVIKCLYEDKQGNLWIGTDRGLNKYSPQNDKFTHFLSKTGDKNSLSNNTITAITQKQQLWIGTFNGLNQFLGYDDNGTALFKRYQNLSNNPNSLSNNRIYCLLTDSIGTIWIGTEGGGLNYINNQNNKQPIHIKRIQSGKGGLLGNIVYSIQEYSKEILLVGTELGVNVIKRKGEKLEIESFRHPEATNAPIFSIIKDQHQNIWLGTYGDGLNYFDPLTRKFVSYKNDPLDPNSINRNYVYSLFESNDGIIWIATREAGVDRIDPKLNRFKHINHKLTNNNSLSNNVVKAVVEGPDGNIWIGTFGGGLNKYNPHTGEFTHYIHHKNASNSIASNIIESLCFDDSGRLWLGTSNGLDLFIPETESFSHFQHHPEKNSLINNYIWSIYPSRDKKGIWIATYDGLDKFNWETGKFHHFKNDPNNPQSLSYNFLRSVYEDKNGHLWICTWGGGLDKLDLKKNTTLENARFEHLRYNTTNNKSISSDLVNTIYVQNDTCFWIGTQQGLNKLNPVKNTIKYFTINDGLADNVVKGILIDKQGYLWISTQNGLSKFNPETESFINYKDKDGLQGNIYNLSSCFYSTSGQMYFGGNNGLSVFKPEEIIETQDFPELYLDNLKINNQTISPNTLFNNRNILQQELNYQPKITLKHFENNLNISFSAIEYSAPDKIKFRYKLTNAENSWNYTNSQNRQVTYSGLKPGTYHFNVQSTNLMGEWSKTGINKTIVIQPPYWASKYAYALYLLMTSFCLWLLLYTNRQRQLAKHEQLLREKEKDKKLELEKFKLQFFTNISHEIRTPLTLISGPLERLMTSKLNAEERHKNFTIIKRSTDILLRLVNQLLDFRKLDNKMYKIKVYEQNIEHLIKTYINTFEAFAKQKNILIDLICTPEFLTKKIPVDTNALEKIILNLISNAIKFTPHNGKITISIYPAKNCSVTNEYCNSNYICISIKDEGPGISVDQQAYIFDRFTQINHQHQQGGTGIGLSFTQKLVEAHNGHISLKSEPGKGATFYLFFPVSIDSYEKENIALQPTLPQYNQEKEEKYFDISKDHPNSDEPEKHQQSNNKDKILIVEDNTDMRNFIKDCLQSQYNTLTADNGKDGLDLAISEGPDLIISDVMMPVMDGLEFCKNIKSNINTSHTPIILLTAKNTLEDEMAGLEFGADQYISKPFNIKHLHLIIRNTLDYRKKIQNQFNGKHMPKPKEISVTSADEKFFTKLNEILEREISNPDLTVESIATKLGLSTVHLYRKLKALAGMPPSRYIRTFRLKRAAQLLKQNKLQITEITYMVGFSEPKYFRKCFKEEFGTNPSTYKKST